MCDIDVSILWMYSIYSFHAGNFPAEFELDLRPVWMDAHVNWSPWFRIDLFISIFNSINLMSATVVRDVILQLQFSVGHFHVYFSLGTIFLWIFWLPGPSIYKTREFEYWRLPIDVTLISFHYIAGILVLGHLCSWCMFTSGHTKHSQPQCKWVSWLNIPQMYFKLSVL